MKPINENRNKEDDVDIYKMLQLLQSQMSQMEERMEEKMETQMNLLRDVKSVNEETMEDAIDKDLKDMMMDDIENLRAQESVGLWCTPSLI